MTPSIPFGGTMSIKTDDFETVEVGDVVSYEVPEYADYSSVSSIHHRVVGKLDDGGYVMKGDGNDSIDDFVVYDEDIVSKDVQYGYQPLYIPISPFAIVFTVGKIYKKVRGRHTELLEEVVETEIFLGNCSRVNDGELLEDTEYY